jgi:magnesium transporter
VTAIRVSLLDPSGLRQGGEELIASWQRDSGARLWVDILDPTEEVLTELLENRFGFHELAAEDSLSTETLPKYDAYPDYDFFVFHAVDIDLREHGATTIKVASFLGRDFLFTIHHGAIAAIDATFDRLRQDKRFVGNGPDFVLHSIVDQIVDRYFPVIEQVEDCVDHLQDTIFEQAAPQHLDELLHLKRDVNKLRRHALPQRELVNAISRGDTQFVQKQHLIYFRDVYDHLYRIAEMIEAERDMIAGAMEAYLSVIANRTNEIMRVLTVLSTIIMPPTLIAGIYGMNFVHMPELRWPHGYLFAILLMVISTGTMLLFFKRKGWIGKPADLSTRMRRGNAGRGVT